MGSAAGKFSFPKGVATSPSGQVYVADTGNNRVEEFSATGTFVRAWGWGVSDGASSFEICTSSCQAGAPGGGAGQFHGPAGIATDSSGNVYVADDWNQRVDEFSPAGAFVLAFGDAVDQTTGGDVCTAASGDVCKAGNSGNVAGQMANPAGVAVDGSGNVYVADMGNDRIDVYSSVSGAYDTSFGSFGAGAGQMKEPLGVATRSGNVYVSDNQNQRVDQFTTAGAFVKAWGFGVSNGAAAFQTCTSSCQAGVQGGAAGQLNGPAGIAADSAGNVYVADSTNARLDEFSSAGTFVRAWGWGVSDGGSTFETCTSTCQAGVSGSHNSQFGQVSGVAPARDNSGTVYVADAANERVETFLNAWWLGVAKAGTGVGTVTSAIAGIKCGKTCAQSFGDGTVVTLTAAPDIGSTFAGWTSGCTGTSQCILTMNRARVVKATFKRAPQISAVSVSASDLRRVAKELHYTIYWAGPESGHTYELSRTSNGYLYIRYLPAGVPAGSTARYLTVATYPFDGALKALKQYAKGKEFSIPGGGYGYKRKPTDYILAWPKVNFQVEVYSPSAAEASKVARSGHVKPV